MRRRIVFTVLAFGLSLPATAGWRWVAEGDCIGPQLQGAPGNVPEPDRCTPEMAGKTALCFPQACYPGCQYLDLPSSKCLPGADTGQIYTCEPEPAQPVK
ncbi:MAG TPA: hypothetical protein PLW81_02710 [Thiobacillaceae bacterium]|nr:hypothetical protein [Thiobacillaceae bacterium]